MLTIICPLCGKESPEGTAFCTGCGTQLESPPTEATPDAATPPAPLPTPTPAAPPRRTTPVWWSVLRCLLSILPTILLTVVLVGLLSLLGLRNLTQTNSLQTILKRVNVSEFIAESASAGREDSLAALVYEEYYEKATESDMEVILTEDELETFLEDSTFEEFIAEKFGEYLGAVMGGRTDVKVTKSELLSLVKENEELIEDITDGHTLTEQDYAAIEDLIDESGVVEKLDMSQMNIDELDLNVEDIHFLTSTLIFILIGIALALLAVIALLNMRGNFLTSLYSGIALLVSGAVTSLTVLLKPILLAAVGDSMGSLSESTVSSLFSALLSGFWTFGLFAVLAGVLCIALFILMRVRAHRRSKA